MTPLAYRIVKQSWTPLKRRPPFDDEGHLAVRMDDIHCFEVSEVFELADELGFKQHQASIGSDGLYAVDNVDKGFAFLPAPKTWIEWRGGPHEEKGYRTGVLLEETPDGSLALCTFAHSIGDRAMRSFKSDMVIALRSCTDFGLKFHPRSQMTRAWQITTLYRLYAFLALINSPKVIGRFQHTVHRTLVKTLAGHSFPLHAWTEIRLEVAKPTHIADGNLHQAYLTGQRALHFCRAHVRIRLGRLEYVSSHWRGDASIGIKRSRYKVTKAQA